MSVGSWQLFFIIYAWAKNMFLNINIYRSIGLLANVENNKSLYASRWH